MFGSINDTPIRQHPDGIIRRGIFVAYFYATFRAISSYTEGHNRSTEVKTIQIDILKTAEILGACSVILGAAIGAYKLYDRMYDRLSVLERRVAELEAENARIKKEDALVIYALRACLDGLHQKGCNGRVTDAIEMIDKHINKAAHDQS